MDLTITIAFGLSLFAVACGTLNLFASRHRRYEHMLNRMIELERR